MKQKWSDDEEYTNDAVPLATLLAKGSKEVKRKKSKISSVNIWNKWSQRSEADLKTANKRLALILKSDEYIEWYIRPSGLLLPQFYLTNKRFIQPKLRLSTEQTVSIKASIPYFEIFSVEVSGIFLLNARIKIVCRDQENFVRGNLYWGAAHKTKRKLTEKIT